MRANVLGMGLLAGLCVLLAGGPAANALVVTETESFTLTAPQVNYTVTRDGPPPATVTTNSPQAVSQALTFDQFDAGLGTLTGVTITFATTHGGTATVMVGFNDESTTDFSSDASVGHTITSPLITTASSPQLFSATCTAGGGGGSCADTTPATGIDFSGSIGVLAPLASFIGTGTYDLTATLNSALAPRISPDNGTGFAANTTFTGTLAASWDGSVSVAYTFEPQASVPLPWSLYLLVAGLGGLALLRRHRR